MLNKEPDSEQLASKLQLIGRLFRIMNYELLIVYQQIVASNKHESTESTPTTPFISIPTSFVLSSAHI